MRVSHQFFQQKKKIISRETSTRPAHYPFVPRTLWKEYPLLFSLAPFFNPRMIESWTEYGIWPFKFCVYEGDTEPDLPKKRFLWPRVMVWSRIESNSTGVKHRWIAVGGKRDLHGYISVRDDDYDADWPDNTRYKKNKWLKRDSLLYDKVEVQIEDFLHAYRKSATYEQIDEEVRGKMVSYVQKRGKRGSLVRKHYLLRDKITGQICAGISYESSPSTRNSHYAVGFINSYEEKKPVMLGLIVEWIEEERRNGYIQFQLGIFWKKGRPENWKGYSIFKGQFKPKMIEFPESLVKIKWFW